MWTLRKEPSFMKKQRRSIQPKPKPIEPRLFIAIIASAVFAGVFVGLVVIGHHGGIERPAPGRSALVRRDVTMVC